MQMTFLKKVAFGAMALAACAALRVAGCASAPRAGSVEPLDVLPPEAALYVYVPVAQYQDFARAVLKGAASGMSDKDSERVLSRTEDADFLASAILRETSTFGVRRADKDRYELARTISRDSSGRRVKSGSGYGAAKSKIEFEDRIQ